MAPVRVLLVTPDPLFAGAFAAAVRRGGRVEPVGAAADPAEAAGLAAALAPDAVLVGAGGAPAVREVRQGCPGVRVIALGVGPGADDILDAVQAGADGFVPTGAALEDVVAVIEAVHAGRPPCPPGVLAASLERARRRARAAGPPAALSRREREVLGLLAGGLVNKEIARRLGVTVCTVKNHVHNLLDKLGVDGRRAAARLAESHRVPPALPPGPSPPAPAASP